MEADGGFKWCPFRGYKLKIILPKPICTDREMIDELEKNWTKSGYGPLGAQNAHKKCVPWSYTPSDFDFILIDNGWVIGNCRKILQDLYS